MELVFHTAVGATVAADGVGPRHVLAALDRLSEDGWELVGPPTVLQSAEGSMATSYMLRRPKPATGGTARGVR
jgi:hypothetical protein